MNFKVLPPEMGQVCLLLYKPGKHDPFLNKLVASVDGPFSHVEIAFLERFGDEPWEREVWGSSIYQGETVFFKPKTYMRDGYVSIAIEVTMPQMLKMKAFCQSQADEGIPFCRNAMYAAYLPWQIVDSPGTFCSKHVTKVLQYGGVYQVKDINPALMTPSSLFRLFNKKEPILQVVPRRLLPENTADCSANMARDMLQRLQEQGKSKF